MFEKLTGREKVTIALSVIVIVFVAATVVYNLTPKERERQYILPTNSYSSYNDNLPSPSRSIESVDVMDRVIDIESNGIVDVGNAEDAADEIISNLNEGLQNTTVEEVFNNSDENPIDNVIDIEEAQPVPSTEPVLHFEITNCKHSYDISHGMGEVTNLFGSIKNIGDVPAQNITLSLTASDPSARHHPDESKTISILQPEEERTFKLTIDTTYDVYTAVTVTATCSNCNHFAEAYVEDCKFFSESITSILKLITTAATITGMTG